MADHPVMNCSTLVRARKCSGNGYLCMPQNVCLCDAGWTSLNDYNIIEGANCTINITSILCLSILDLVLSTAFLLLITRYISVRIRTITCRSMEPKSLCPFAFAAFGVVDFLCAISKLAYAEPALVGRDIGISILQSMFVFSCFISLTLYYRVVLKFLKGYARMMSSDDRNNLRHYYSVLQKYSWLIVLFSIPVSSAPTLTLFYPSHILSLTILGVAGTGVLVFIYGLFFTTAIGILLSELAPYVNTASSPHLGDLRVVCMRMRITYYLGGGIILFGSSAMAVFGSWDFLLNKVSYIIIFVRIIGMILFMILTMTLSRIAPNLMKIGVDSSNGSGSVSRSPTFIQVSVAVDQKDTIPLYVGDVS